jgi:hypothetical protein
VLCWVCTVGCQDGTQNNPFAQVAPSELAAPTASLVAAARSATASPPAAQPARSEPAAVPQPAAAASPGALPEFFPGTSLPVAQILSVLGAAELQKFRPVGTTSTVFRSAIAAPFRAAFKLATRQNPYGPVAEVAAYRLARCLGLSNVPPAVLRTLDVNQLRAGLEAPFRERWPSIAERLLIQHGSVEGAAIFWVEGMRDLDMAAGPPRETQLRALSQSEPLPERMPPLAAQLSNLLAFDYLIANWDRWSGANVKGDLSGRILYMRDHDVGFAAHVGELQQRRMLGNLLAAERFSRGFVARLRALTRSAYERELAEDAGFAGQQRLSAASLDGLFDRRITLLSHVQALIDQYGESRVLAFP